MLTLKLFAITICNPYCQWSLVLKRMPFFQAIYSWNLILQFTSITLKQAQGNLRSMKLPVLPIFILLPSSWPHSATCEKIANLERKFFFSMGGGYPLTSKSKFFRHIRKKPCNFQYVFWVYKWKKKKFSSFFLEWEGSW